MRVTIRRNERVGERADTPVEDLGIIPDILNKKTRTNLLKDNVDMKKKACEIFESIF